MNQKGIIFDLDDTLYSEKKYVMSGFKVISKYLEERYSINSSVSFNYLQSNFELNGRHKIFNALLDKLIPELSKVQQKSAISNMVEIYRNHPPNIRLNIEITNILKEIKSLGWKISIVTDGLPLMQKNKIASLGLDLLADNVVYCWDYNSPKPSPLGFKIASEMMNVEIKKCLVVGDHPENDIVPARKLNAKAYRIRTKRFAHLDSNSDYQPIKTYSNLVDFFNEVIKI